VPAGGSAFHPGLTDEPPVFVVLHSQTTNPNNLTVADTLLPGYHVSAIPNIA